MARPSRLSTALYIGPNAYFITACTHLRAPRFVDPEMVLDTLTQFRLTALEDRIAILAYCFMPDHLHLLVQGLAGESLLTRFVRVAKQRTAFRYSRRSNGAVLWQAGYFDRIVRSDDNIRAIASYIIQNPVRAGLVSSALQFPYIGSDVWTIPEILEAGDDRQ